MREGRGPKRLDRLLAGWSGDEHLARLDVPHVGRPYQIEGARLGAHDRGVAQTPESQRTEAMGIPNGDQLVLGHHRERERPAHLRKRFDDGAFRRGRFRSRVQMKNDFGIGRGLEDGALTDHLVFQLGRIDEVAVVADGNLAVGAVNHERAGVAEPAPARRRVPHVADGHRSDEAAERHFVERVVDVRHGARHVDLTAVRRGDTCALLPAVLQRVQAKVGHVGRFGVTEDAKDAALLMKLV